MRKNTHGLAQALGSDYSLYLRIGYAVVVPDSEFGEDVNVPGLTDITVAPQQSLLIDRENMDAPALAARILERWRSGRKLSTAKRSALPALRALLRPYARRTKEPRRGEAESYNNRIWLRLTHEQSSVVHTVMAQTRIAVTGWPSTGKTLIAIEIARRMIAQGKRVMMLTFNSLLVDFLRKEIGIAAIGKVATWHGFCSDYARRLGEQHSSDSRCKNRFAIRLGARPTNVVDGCSS
jgi:hypothetical protein